MSGVYEIVDVPEQPCVFIRRTISQNQLGEFYMELLPKVFQYITEQGQPGAPPFGRYPDWGETDCTVEGGVTTWIPLPGNGEIVSGTLDGCKAVHATHMGSYDGLQDSYQKLFAWFNDQGYKVGGAPFEVYVDDPGSKPEAEVRTEIYTPIA
ncbi:MAG: GyrI-like domain-containing protein [Fimbriimonadales bacterium]